MESPNFGEVSVHVMSESKSVLNGFYGSMLQLLYVTVTWIVALPVF
jgi:hypothetical protein